MSKTTTLRIIYQIENEINRLHGKSEINLETLPAWKLEEEANKSKRYDLVERLERAQRFLAKAKADKVIEEGAAAYYATPEGEAYKQQVEENINVRDLAIKAINRQTSQQIEGMIQRCLGSHWVVIRYYPNQVSIGVLNPKRTNPESNECIFGQDIEIRYDNDINFKGEREERFETNVATCGSFEMEGGNTIGQRANYYIGIGRLFSDTDLLASLKQLMHNSCETTDQLHTELKHFKEELKNPSPAK